MAKTLEETIMATVAKAREQISAGTATLHRLSGDGRWSESTKAKMVADAKGEMHTEVNATMTDAAGAIGREQARAEKAMAAASVILHPLMGVVAKNTGALVLTYQRLYDDRAARTLLEKVAATLPDILTQAQMNEFGGAWQIAEEQAACATIARTQEAHAYLRDATSVLNRELAAVTGATLRDNGSGLVGTANARFRMRQFEESVAAVAG
jgi:hypothetical protein